MGLLDSLSIGMRGLNASQSAIDVTGQNISNANTEGYSRKRVNLQSEAVNDPVYGEKGLGVEVTEIDRIRDEFLDRQTWEAMGDKGYDTQLDTAYTRIGNILKEPSEDGLAAKMNAFWASWQDLANSPSDASAREAVKSSANVMIDSFQSVYKQIQDYGLSMNNPLQEATKQVNDLTDQIYNLNQQIAEAEATKGQKANDSRDQRDLLVRKLSSMVDVQTIEDGNGRLIITSGGNLMVGPSGALKIETYGVDKTLANGDKASELRIRFTDSRRAFDPRSGELKGIMDARSKVLSTYMDDLNSLASSIVQQVNDQHELGYTMNHATGVPFFDPAKISAGNMSLSDAIVTSSDNIAAAEGGKIVDVASFAPVGGIPPAGNPVLDLKNTNPTYRDLADKSVTVTLSDGTVLQEGAGADYVVDQELGTIKFLNYARYSAGDAINVQFKYNTTGYSGDGNGQNALLVAGLRLKNALVPSSDGTLTQSVTSFYSATIGRLGIEQNQNKSRLDTKSSLISQMDTEQATTSGVSLDEEMTNMIKFENSYRASAKYITTVSQMMDVLMQLAT
jgi:flagellar hook-associated protein 1 FlgK